MCAHVCIYETIYDIALHTYPPMYVILVNSFDYICRTISLTYSTRRMSNILLKNIQIPNFWWHTWVLTLYGSFAIFLYFLAFCRLQLLLQHNVSLQNFYSNLNAAPKFQWKMCRKQHLKCASYTLTFSMA